MNWRKRDWLDVWSTVTACVSWSVLLILVVVTTLLFLTGCSIGSRGVLVLESRLTAPVDRPALQGVTNRDVWRLAIEQDEVIEECDARMRTIRQLTRTPQ
jgi:hypothetical protein